MKKSNKLFVIIAILLIVIIIVFLFVANIEKHNIKDYDSYSLNINVVLSNTEKEIEYNIDTVYDGEKMYIKPEHLDNYYFYMAGQIIELNNDEYAIYTYNTDYSYLKLYSLCNKVSKNNYVKESNDEIEYSFDMDDVTANELIKNIYLNRTIKGNATLTVIIKNNRIISVEINAVTTEKEVLRINLHYSKEMYKELTEYDEFINRYQEKIVYDQEEHAASKRHKITPEYKKRENNILLLE